MTPLSDALTAAQRSALAALEKAYVGAGIDQVQFADQLESCGISDPIDVAFLVASLDVLREWGVSAPTMTERVAEAKDDPASDKQWTLIRKLCEEKQTEPPDQSLTKTQASLIIDAIQKGVYDPKAWRVPF